MGELNGMLYHDLYFSRGNLGIKPLRQWLFNLQNAHRKIRRCMSKCVHLTKFNVSA